MRKLIFLFVVTFLISLVSAQFGYNNENLPRIVPATETTTTSGGEGSNVTSVTSSTNCILVNPTTGDVILTFNESCAGEVTAGVNSVSSGDDYIVSNPTTGDVILSIDETILNGTVLDIASDFNETNLILSVNTTSNIMSLGFYNETEVDDLISALDFLTEAEADTLYYSISNPSGYFNSTNFPYTHLSNFTDDLDYSDNNVNSSDYWDNLDSVNGTQFENNGGVLNLLESWLTSFINSFGFLDDDVYIDDSELPLANRTTPNWNNITGRPEGLDDGDNDTTYTAGANLSLVGEEFSLDTTSVKDWLDTIYQAINDGANFFELQDDYITNSTTAGLNITNVTIQPNGKLTLLGLEIYRSASSAILSPLGAVQMVIGTGEAGKDYSLTFDGQDSNGVITWFEDEDTFFIFPSAQTFDSFTVGGDLIVSGGSQIVGNEEVLGNFTAKNGTFLGTSLTVDGNEVCQSDGTNCLAIPDGDGTGGWTNDSIQTNTSLNVNINNGANITQGNGIIYDNGTCTFLQRGNNKIGVCG